MSDPTSGGDAGGAPPPMPPPVNPGNMGRGPMIMGVSWSLTALCVLVIGLRFYVRKTVIRAWSSDDWFMLAAVVCCSGSTSCSAVTNTYIVVPDRIHGLRH